jgi:BON domain
VPIRTRYLIAFALGVFSAEFLQAQEPRRLGLENSLALPLQQPVSVNQQLADAIARQLKQSGQLHGYRIDLACRGGDVEASGMVANQSQREEALRLIQGVPGVERVFNRLALAEGENILQAQAPPVPPNEAAPVLPPVLPLLPRELPGVEKKAEAAQAPQAPQDPLPMLPPPTGGAQADLNPPRMPPYAWPTYAPYNNFSRVAYPTAYPYNAWPFIGPVNPFPKIPLGWRSVKLEFDEGYWWFSRVASKHDWWRLKYQ